MQIPVPQFIKGFIASVKKDKRKSKIIARQPIDRVKMEIGNLTRACDNALDPINSDRTELITFYGNAWKDSQVISEREKAEAYLITEPFEVRTGGKPDEEKTTLLKKPWFSRFLKFAMWTEFWEYTLIEFGQQDAAGNFIDVIVFPRRHIRPFEKMIVVNPTDREGASYEGIETDLYLLELGDPEDLGKLESITREVIWKNFARSDWSEYNERYGKPFLDFGVTTDNEAELDEKEEMAANFGANGWIVRDKEDEVNIISVTSRASAENFKDKAIFCDDQIAKLMNGQTGTSDEKSFVGSAEVHERVLNKFTEARLTRIQDIINYKLFPFLRYHGYPLTEDDTFVYPALEEAEKKRKAKNEQNQVPEQPDDPNDPEASLPGKKKIIPFARLGYKYAGGVTLPLYALQSSKEITLDLSAIEPALKKIYEGRRPAAYSPELFRHDFKQMAEGITESYGTTGIRFGDTDWAMAQNLKYNTAVFDAFKSNHEVKEAYRLLTWDDGTPRTWKEFKQDALRVAESYNQRYLQTEFNQAHTAAKAARKWQDYQRDKDLYPNLRYLTVGDERTRHSHAELSGYVIPIDHPFWNKFYPPNGWGCRCSVQPTDDPVKLPPGEPAIPDGFQNNVGKTAQVWDESHPYYKGMTETEKDNIYQFVRQNIRPAKEVLEAWQQYEGAGENWLKGYFNGDNGGWLLTDQARKSVAKINKTELLKYKKEETMCRVFARSGYRIEHLPEQSGISSPDIRINGKPAELKRVKNHNNIVKYAVKAVKKQGAEEVLFQIDKLDHAVRLELAKVKDRGIMVRYFVTGEPEAIHSL